MNRFTKKMVDDYADKLLIGLTDEENKQVLEEFEIIDKNCDIVTRIENINNVKPMTHCLDDFCYELREDVVEESVPIDELLSNCKNIKDREIELIKVVK